MAIGVLFEFSGVTKEQYEQVSRGLTGGGLLARFSDWPVPGILFHVAGPTDDGWRVVDVWESPEAFEAFAQKIMPLLAEAGIPANPPSVFPAHNLVTE